MARTKPRKRPSQARSRATVEALLEATAQVLLEDGWDRASTNRIADRAGVSIGSLYQYFPNKEAMAAELLRRHIDRMTDVLADKLSEVSDAPLPHAARSLVSAFLLAHRVDPALHKVLIARRDQLGIAEHRDAVDARVLRMVRLYLKGRQDELAPGLDLDLATWLVVHTVIAITHQTVLDEVPAPDDEALVDELTRLVVGYLSG